MWLVTEMNSIHKHFSQKRLPAFWETTGVFKMWLRDMFERTCQGLTPWATTVAWAMVHRENSQFGDCPTTLNCQAINMTINATVNVTKRRIIARSNMPGLTAYKSLLPVYSVYTVCLDLQTLHYKLRLIVPTTSTAYTAYIASTAQLFQILTFFGCSGRWLPTTSIFSHIHGHLN